jgi:D-alanyl-D-alanine carboxypeptidase (penicillin-binding protein 5/6)
MQTKFANPHGLMNKDNKSTAYDIAKLACYALKNEIIKSVVKTPEYTCIVHLEDSSKQVM